MSTVLLSRAAQRDANGIRDALENAGFTVLDHVLGSTPAVDFEPVSAAVIVVGERTEIAAAQTRRWRIELGDQIVPMLWLVPESTPGAAIVGLEAGADACWSRRVEEAVLIAQVKAQVRIHAAGARLGIKADETRLLGEQLRKAYSQLERESELGRRIHRGVIESILPTVGAVRFASNAPVVGENGFHEVRRLDEHHLGFMLGNILGGASRWLGLFIHQAAKFKEITGDSHRLVPPEEVLIGINRDLMGLGLEEMPLVALLVGIIDARDGSMAIARAGLPAPIFIPATGEPQLWVIPGPFLGTSATTYTPYRSRLSPGDNLLLAGDGIPPTANLLEAARPHRELRGQEFVNAVAGSLFCDPMDIALLAIEMVS
ncbi:MAG TPA: SpoIIE family protein phosphatase [Urbifossiella sp.]